MDSDNQAVLREPPVAGNEVDTLLGALERQRGYVAWKCGNLDSAGLRATLGPSAVTLGGLLKHLAAVEDDVFSVKLHGRDPHPPWDTVDWDADPEEYARHVGHADLIRESVDGLVGEDPP
jgi:hypothetical protein